MLSKQVAIHHQNFRVTADQIEVFLGEDFSSLSLRVKWKRTLLAMGFSNSKYCLSNPR